MAESRLRCRPLTRMLRVALLGALVTAGWLAAAPIAPRADATPLQQDLFQCDADGVAGVGIYQCHQWVTASAVVAPGASYTHQWTCDAGRVVATWTYHWEGAPFTITDHHTENGGQILVATATNNSSTRSGEYWVSGRCRTT